MINELVFMEIRLIRAFCERYRMRISQANQLFIQYNIWDYIESCYDVLHMNGDEYNLNDICSILKQKGVVL